MPYLTREAIIATLDFIAAIKGAEVVFDYAEPFENYPPAMQANLRAVAERAASIGEPWLSLFNPPEMAALMQARRFAAFEDVTRAELAARYYGDLGRGPAIGPGSACRAGGLALGCRSETACSGISIPSARSATAAPPPW